MKLSFEVAKPDYMSFVIKIIHRMTDKEFNDFLANIDKYDEEYVQVLESLEQKELYEKCALLRDKLLTLENKQEDD